MGLGGTTMRLLPIGLLGLLLSAGPARAVDYAKIDRTLTREPAYRTKAPTYALLLFGQRAKVRVWIVLDGETVYLDRNADGDLTGKNERFAKLADCKDIEIADPDGKTRYVITSIGSYPEGKPPRPHLMVNVDIKGPLQYRQYCDLQMRDSAGKAALAHFHGPLTIGPRTINWKLPPQLALTVGEKPVDLAALVGTMSAEYGCWVVMRSHQGDKPALPKGVFPVVDVEFPAAMPGAGPVKKRYQLDKFC
jgi:hypothetical protein